MPKRLLDRCQPDSILEFRSAARERFDDGLASAAAGRRTGAIYLWGYSAEMTIKAAYFSLVGVTKPPTIAWKDDLLKAILHGQKTYGIVWPNSGQGHNIRAWSELLVSERSSSSATSYRTLFARQVQKRGQRFEGLWKETLRYSSNYAYSYEVEQIREAAQWLLVHSPEL